MKISYSLLNKINLVILTANVRSSHLRVYPYFRLADEQMGQIYNSI